MARQEIPIVVLGADGRPVAGASAYVRTDPGGADATIYQAKTGGATFANPRTSDAQGRIEGWLERGDYAATVTVSGLPPWVEYFPITPAADGALDGLWLSDDVIVARHVADAAIVRAALDNDLIREHPSGLLTPAQFLALPAQRDGTVVRVQPDAASVLNGGVVWRLRLDGASVNAAKWVFDGGSPLFGLADGGQNITSAGYTSPAPPGPDVTVPLAGDYDYEGQAQAYNQTATLTTPSVGVSVAGSAIGAGDGWAITLSANINQGGPIPVRNRRTGVAAGALFRMVYASPASVQFSARKLYVQPVRVVGPAVAP
jgi:hypothetical protein